MGFRLKFIRHMLFIISADTARLQFWSWLIELVSCFNNIKEIFDSQDMQLGLLYCNFIYINKVRYALKIVVEIVYMMNSNLTYVYTLIMNALGFIFNTTWIKCLIQLTSQLYLPIFHIYFHFQGVLLKRLGFSRLKLCHDLV